MKKLRSSKEVGASIGCKPYTLKTAANLGFMDDVAQKVGGIFVWDGSDVKISKQLKKYKANHKVGRPSSN